MCDNIPDITEHLDASIDWYLDSKTKFGKNKNTTFQGPLEESNWLIPGTLLLGAYPSPPSFTPEEANGFMKKLLDCGIDIFVCLNAEYGTNIDHYAYATDDPDDPFLFGAKGMKALSTEKNKRIEFILLKIIDMNVTGESEVKELCEHLKKQICEGKKIYIHCTGGHGRTGTIASILLSLLYPTLTAEKILEYLQFTHDQRVSNYNKIMYIDQLDEPIDSGLKKKFQPGQVPTPQTSAQRKQVKKIIIDLKEEMEGKSILGGRKMRKNTKKRKARQRKAIQRKARQSKRR